MELSISLTCRAVSLSSRTLACRPLGLVTALTSSLAPSFPGKDTDVFREEAPKKAGQAYPQVATGTGHRVLATIYETLRVPRAQRDLERLPEHGLGRCVDTPERLGHNGGDPPGCNRTGPRRKRFS